MTYGLPPASHRVEFVQRGEVGRLLEMWEAKTGGQG